MWSKYNYFFQKGSSCFLYNSLSNSFAELSAETYAYLREKQDANSIDIEDNDLKQTLVKMKVFVTSDQDEINKIKYIAYSRRYNRDALNLTINPTLSCNFNCPYCFEGQHPNIYMSDEIENQLIKFIEKFTSIKRLNITWFGGEPLMAFKRICSITEKIKEMGISFTANMITNGYLLDAKVASKLADLNIKNIQITIDGLAKLHDSRRCLLNGNGTFDRIIKNIDQLQAISPQTKITIRVNIDDTNKNEFADIYMFFKQKEYPNVFISAAFVDNDTECQTDENILNSNKKAQFLLDMQKKCNMDSSIFYPNNQRYECGIRNANTIVVGPEGELYKCWNDVGHKEQVVGYLNGKVTNESLLLKYLVGADPFEDPKCMECLLLPVCGGGCPYIRLKNLSNKGKYNTCDLLKDNIEDFLYCHYISKPTINP